MKKLFSLLVVTIVSLFALETAQAQQLYPVKGHSSVNIGLGVGSNFVDGDVNIPPIGVSYQTGITENIMVGGYLGYAQSDWGFGNSWKTNYLIIGARGLYVFNEDFDAGVRPYAGVMLSANRWSSDVENGDGFGNDYSDSDTELGLSLFAGATYKVSEKVNVFGEVGFGLSVLQLGVNFNLK